MSYVARLLTESGINLDFTVCKTDRGYIANAIHPTVTEISTPGTDARRFRRERNGFQVFQMDTVADYATYTQAVDYAQTYESAIGQVCALAMVAADYSVATYNVQVLDVSPRVAYGFSGGTVLTPNGTTPTAILRAAWRIVCTEAA